MTTFFTSDLHFGHFNIIDYSQRPFSSVDEMNGALIDNWNHVVSDDDVVWILGDIALGKIAETLPLVGLLNGRKLLVPGNHDRCWTGHKKIGTWREKYVDAGIEAIFDGPLDYTLHGFTVMLSHFPYRGDSHDTDRFTEHRPVDDGHTFLLHGHVHEAWKRRDRMINVGVDVWDYRPVSIDEIAKLLSE